ncbi:hypothetical protein B296_00010396, partial [Ensete ventricosum]
MKTRSERHDKRRYCHFHREHDHDTEECRDLQNQIEDLIRQGHLCRYVHDQPIFPDNRPTRDSSPRPKGPVEKQIDVIIGGPASDGDSSSAHKAYARTMVGKRPKHDDDLNITFRSGNKEYPDHDDALTTPKTLIGESPFSLAFGIEAILPPEVVYPTLRVEMHDEEASSKQLCENLDLLEEKRADAHMRTLAYKKAVAKLYNCKVRPRSIKSGDLVLQKTEV